MTNEPSSLDPADWLSFRAQGHAMLDDIFDHLVTLRSQPLWQPPPDEVRSRFSAPLPGAATPMERVHRQFLEDIAPYSSGNAHPGFMGWVQGGGTPVGMLAEMLAAGLNMNLGGRDHMGIEVERQIVRWMAEVFQFPKDASGLFLTGASMANFCAILIARTRALGAAVRASGLGEQGMKLRAYTSAAAHNCIERGMEMSGLGRDALRSVSVNSNDEIDLDALRRAIEADRQAGFVPFLIVGTAGAVNTGATDDLNALADLSAAESIHFHVDGAFGALAVLVPELAEKLRGLERADSIAFDFHKWAQVPYDAGFLLVRDPVVHRATFASDAAYLRRGAAGLAGGEWWPCDLGPDLSRGFRALKTWFTLKTFGLDGIAQVIRRACELASKLGECVDSLAELELCAPVQLNVVCFRYRCSEPNETNARIVEQLHLQGAVAPSLSTIDGKTVIRAAIVNHRTGISDIETLVAEVVRVGRACVRESDRLGASRARSEDIYRAA